MDTKNREKIFTPLVLFNTSCAAETNPHQKYQIEKHRLKVERLLEKNTRIWENEASYYPISSEIESKEITISDTGPSRSFLSQPTTNESSLSNALDPKTRTKTPPLLNIGSLSSNKKANSDRRLSNAKSNHFVEEGKDTFHLESSGFISEPSFQNTYKPHSVRKRRGNLPKEVTEFLKQWLILHKRHPYPTEREKQQLADETGLMVSQISNWFINARRRILQPLLESENRQQMIQSSGPYFTDVGNAEMAHPDLLTNQQAFYYHNHTQIGSNVSEHDHNYFRH